MKRIPLIFLAVVGLLLPVRSEAAAIAVFGDNATDNLLASNGHAVTLVSDAQLATAGFLNAFDVFYYTRDDSSFGSGLSAAAAANVIAFATGNAVALNADFADSIPGEANINQLTLNAVNFAAASGHGFVGEFNGAVAALGSNSDGFAALGLFAGSAGPLDFGNGGSDLNVVADSVNGGSPILAGVGLPYNPAEVEFGAALSGYSAAQVIARFGDSVSGNPAVLARRAIAVPEPVALSLMGLGLAALAVRSRRIR